MNCNVFLLLSCYLKNTVDILNEKLMLFAKYYKLNQNLIIRQADSRTDGQIAKQTFLFKSQIMEILIN